ncbi:MAG: hypothetical protein AAGF95_05135 [Chloroflexota bacterium]
MQRSIGGLSLSKAAGCGAQHPHNLQVGVTSLLCGASGERW